MGCGTGTFLSVLKDAGAQKVLGIDGPWVDRSLLDIDENEFVEHNLEIPFPKRVSAGLVICLEVAEHLPVTVADNLVALLVSISDLVLFSAAIPQQGGNGHVNEQWQSYWAEKFSTHGFEAFDVVRPALWSDSEVLYWYRQNTLIYRRATPESDKPKCPGSVLDVVHPESYLRKTRVHPLRVKLRKTLQLFRKLSK